MLVIRGTAAARAVHVFIATVIMVVVSGATLRAAPDVAVCRCDPTHLPKLISNRLLHAVAIQDSTEFKDVSG